jgi:tetratricopeptide (TPR) repeat protein
MVEKNDLPSDKDQKLEKLIADYEAAREENRSLYLDGDQLADIASLYINERSFDKAQEVIDYGLKLHPGNTNLMMEQAYLYIFTMEYSKAKSIADSIAYADPTDIKILKAQIALSEDNPDEPKKA